jgi:hypothetical protein
MAQWQSGITILGVNSTGAIYFRNALGIVGWRNVEGHPDGITRALTLAVAAQYSGQKVQLYVENDGTVLVVQTI